MQATFLPSTVLLIAMCSLNDKTDSHWNNVLPVVAIDDRGLIATQRGEGKWLKSSI